MFVRKGGEKSGEVEQGGGGGRRRRRPKNDQCVQAPELHPVPQHLPQHLLLQPIPQQSTEPNQPTVQQKLEPLSGLRRGEYGDYYQPDYWERFPRGCLVKLQKLCVPDYFG